MEEAQAQVEGGSMSAFDEAWDVVKQDEEPDEDFHALNDPNPTVAFGAAVRNNPLVADMMEQKRLAYSMPYEEGGVIHVCKNCGKETDTTREDIWDDDYCCKNCSEGNSPTCSDHGGYCEWELTEGPEYDPYHSRETDSRQYSLELECTKCDNRLWGHLYEM